MYKSKRALKAITFAFAAAITMAGSEARAADITLNAITDTGALAG